MKENIIIGRLIPAGKQYKKIHHASDFEEDLSEKDQYFDNSDDDLVDVSGEYLETADIPLEEEIEV
jgi:hypothetical protein